MIRSVRLWMLAFLIIAPTAIWYTMAAEPALPLSDMRNAAKKDYDAGNFRDAYEKYRPLVLDERNGGKQLGKDLASAWSCLKSLQRDHEQDELLQAAIDAGSYSIDQFEQEFFGDEE